MPIKSLEPFLFERKLAYSSTIDTLTNATIGIDVEHYLNRIYTLKKEQFLAAIGGVPSSLKDYLSSDLHVFKEFNIKPIFIISGLNFQSQVKTYRAKELTSSEQTLENTWNKISNQQKQNPHYHHHFHAFENYRSLHESIPLEPLINDLIKLFIELEIDYLVTPYDTSFQLSYLYQAKIIDAIYGSTDLLLTKIDKFILGMEFQSKDFRYVDKHKVLQELRINERQFQDLSLMVGCNIQPNTFSIFPKPLPNYPPINIFKYGLDSIYQYAQMSGNHQDLYGYILNLNDPKLIDWYLKGQSIIKFAPIITKEGYVELYNVEMTKLGLDKNVDFLSDDEENPTDESGNNTPARPLVKIPNNLHEIISQRLPPELYYYESLGLLPLQLLSSIARGRLDLRPPPELGRCENYKKLINSKFYNNLLDQQYNLITQLLARYYQVKKINVHFWFTDNVLELNNRMNPPIARKVENLFMKSSDKVFNIKNLFANKLVGNYKLENDTDTIETQVDVISSAFIRTLYLYGIIDEKQQLSSIGKILQEFSSKNSDVSDEDFEHLVLILLLLKESYHLTDLNQDYFSVDRPYKDLMNEPNHELNETENKYISLISRILSLKKFNATPINYQGPISRNLLNFRSSIEFVNKNLAQTIEVLMTDLVVRQEKNNVKLNYNKDDWYKLINQIPFFRTMNNTIMGIISEIYFEIVLKKLKNGSLPKPEAIHFAKDHLINNVFQVHSSTHNINVHGINAITADQIVKDFDSAISWWGLFAKFMKEVNKNDTKLCSNTLLKEVEDADKFLKDLT
ncbi:hypothetical protein KGF54_001787 [Candida jiufengensis]|uniref:uncharacterized protein n=1 Tax=Candida jiufengensis TaxID=497108 RepID=UPI00222431CF|nr:uncharacterized protein KGF54_001787 [Candida jiufengensis]KAI5955226.1 hypothetical protein KGF54_001787 [Candida jiufengensis]